MTLSEKDKLILALHNEVAALRLELNESKKRHLSTMKCATFLGRRIDELRKENAELKEKLVFLDNSWNDMYDQAYDAKQENDSLLYINDVLRQENAKLRSAL
jgi:FtsZ-binding cell division protein ZapB